MGKRSKFDKSVYEIFAYLNNNIKSLNNSKMFAGLMIIILNIASKFVTIKLSKTMESYLKHTFSKQILVFAIAWMGTRDIYIAFFISIIFVLMTDYLLNEDSAFCCLSSQFTTYHVSKLDVVTPEEITRAKDILEKAKLQINEVLINKEIG